MIHKAMLPIALIGAMGVIAAAVVLDGKGDKTPLDGPALARESLVTIEHGTNDDVCTIGAQALRDIKARAGNVNDRKVAEASLLALGAVPCTWGGYVSANGGSRYEYSYPGVKVVQKTLADLSAPHASDETLAHRLGVLGVGIARDDYIKTYNQAYDIAIVYVKAVQAQTKDAAVQALARGVVPSGTLNTLQDFLAQAH